MHALFNIFRSIAPARSWSRWGPGLLRLALGAVLVGALSGQAWAAGTTASSSLTQDGVLQGASRAFDGDLSTAWVEGASGIGKGEWLEVDFGGFKTISSVTIFGGFFQDERVFNDYNHLQTAELVLVGRKGVSVKALSFPDLALPLTVEVGLEVKRVRLVLGTVFAGALYSDTGVAEVAFNLSVKDPAVLANLEKWRKKEGQSALARAKDSLLEARKKVEGGDMTALEPLKNAVRLGSIPVRSRLLGLVSPGFLMTYLDPDPVALEALAELGLAEAAPAVEQAVWLMDEIDAPRVKKVAAILRAKGTLQRPLRTNLPLWGTEGLEPGAFQARKEPLPLAVDEEGQIFVADIGNHRVQRFGPGGRFQRAVGASPGVEERFLDRENEVYAAGSRAGTGKGEFTFPLAITAFRAGGEVRVAVVDAARRLQVLDSDLQPLEAWVVPSEEPVQSGVGIAGPALVAIKGELFCLWGREAYVYDLAGKLKRRFTLEKPVRSAVGFNGSLMVNFEGTQVVRYGRDGFRFGAFVSLPESDRSEEIDVAVGPDGFLYLHSDEGKAYRFNKKGRLDSSFTTFKKPTFQYRVAVGPELLLVTAHDRIYPFALP